MIAYARAAAAAAATPRWLSSQRWRTLLTPATPDETAHAAANAATAALPPDVRRFGLRVLRALSLLPRSPWRTTCLYRSVTVCLMLRGAGIPAVLRIGAAGAGAETKAHAWVESPAGDLLYEHRAGYTPLGTA